MAALTLLMLQELSTELLSALLSNVGIPLNHVEHKAIQSMLLRSCSRTVSSHKLKLNQQAWLLSQL